MFALRHIKSGELMGFYTSSNGDGEFCTSEEFILDITTDNIWVVYDRKVAEKAANTDTEWYNAGYSTPRNYYIGKLEVVELQIKD
jgi:hypothetical protein